MIELIGFLQLIPITKIVLGAVVAAYFQNALLGSWWAGLFAMVMCLLTPFAFDGLVGLLLGFVFAVATLAVCIVGVVWDFVTFDYFDDLSKNCPGIENECFCDATEKEFQRDFGALADFNCNNPATRNDGILVANFVFSFLCALQALVFCLALLGAVGKYVVCSRCFESTPPTRAANTAV